MSNFEIPFVDLRKQNNPLLNEILSEIKKVFQASAFSSGKFVEEFEIEFAKYTGAKYCVCVNSGTSAIHLMVIAAGIKAGDEVIIPANTFIATVWGVLYQGAMPVFVDCDPQTYQIDWSHIEGKITEKTKAIIGVHLYGQPFNRDKVKNIAKINRILLLEDAAQAHGALYNNKRLGIDTFLTGYSFYPGKNLGAPGEGGAIVLNDKKMYKVLKSLRNHGSYKKYYHDNIGFNYRMGGLEGASLRVKLRYVETWNQKRINIANRYINEIDNPLINLQHQPDTSQSVYHLFVLSTSNREKLENHLRDNGIQFGKHYPVPCHLQKSLNHFGYKKGDFPVTEYLANSIISLPIYPELIDSHITHIINTINSFNL